MGRLGGNSQREGRGRDWKVGREEQKKEQDVGRGVRGGGLEESGKGCEK